MAAIHARYAKQLIVVDAVMMVMLVKGVNSIQRAIT